MARLRRSPSRRLDAADPPSLLSRVLRPPPPHGRADDAGAELAVSGRAPRLRRAPAVEARDRARCRSVPRRVHPRARAGSELAAAAQREQADDDERAEPARATGVAAAFHRAVTEAIVDAPGAV